MINISSSSQSSSSIEEIYLGSSSAKIASKPLKQEEIKCQQSNLPQQDTHEKKLLDNSGEEAPSIIETNKIAASQRLSDEIRAKQREGHTVQENTEQKGSKQSEKQKELEQNYNPQKKRCNEREDNDFQMGKKTLAEFFKQYEQEEFKKALEVQPRIESQHKDNIQSQKNQQNLSDRSRHLSEILKTFKILQNQIINISLKDKLLSIETNLKDHYDLQQRKFERQELDYLYMLAEGFYVPGSSELFPYETIFPGIDSEEIIQNIFKVIKSFCSRETLQEYHRVKLDFLFDQIIPFLDKYGKQIESQNKNESKGHQNIEQSPQNNRDCEKQSIQPDQIEVRIQNQEKKVSEIQEEAELQIIDKPTVSLQKNINQQQSPDNINLNQKEIDRQRQQKQDKEIREQNQNIGPVVQNKYSSEISVNKQKSQEQIAKTASKQKELPECSIAAPVLTQVLDQNQQLPKQKEIIQLEQSREVCDNKKSSPKLIIKPVHQNIPFFEDQSEKPRPEIRVESEKQIIKIEEEEIEYKPKCIKSQYKLVQNEESCQKTSPPSLQEIRKILEQKLDPSLHKTLRKMGDSQLRQMYESVQKAIQQEEVGKRPSSSTAQPVPEPEKRVVINNNTSKPVRKAQVKQKLEMHINKIHEMLGEIRRIITEGND